MLEKKRYHILLVEDNPFDRKIILEALKTSSENFSLKAAESVSKAQAILSNHVFDAIVSDYELGDGTGLEIIKSAKDTPVILMTGQGNEEIAVEALKAGAYEYLIKHPDHKQINILPLTIKKVISKKAQSQTNQILLSTLEHVADSVCITDLNDKIIFSNDAFCEEHEQSLNMLKGKNFKELDKKYQVNRVHKEPMGKRGAVYELRFINSSGMTCFSSRSQTLIKDESGKDIAKAYISRDITRRKQIEQKQKKLVTEIKKALANVRMLSGLLPICSSCKKIRDNEGDWNTLESYIKSHSEADFSHGLCPECATKLYPEFHINF